MNYMQYPNQQQYKPMAYNNGGWNNRIRPVSSVEEVKAASIDFDGSVFYFSDLANNKIYTKQINPDGTAALKMYELKEIPVTEQPVVDYVTRQEFDEVMEKLKQVLASSAPAKEFNF